MLKKKVGYSTLRAISPEYVLSEENEKHYDTKEDKVDDKEDAWRIITNKKRDVNEVKKLSTHELESDAEENDRCEEDDERY